MIPWSKRNPFSGRAGAQQTLLSPPLPSLLPAPSKLWIWAGSPGLTGGLWWARWWSLPQAKALRGFTSCFPAGKCHQSELEIQGTIPAVPFPLELEQEDVGWRMPRMSSGGEGRIWDDGRGGGEGKLRNEHEGVGRGSPGSTKDKPSSGNGKLGNLSHGKIALS